MRGRRKAILDSDEEACWRPSMKGIVSLQSQVGGKQTETKHDYVVVAAKQAIEEYDRGLSVPISISLPAYLEWEFVESTKDESISKLRGIANIFYKNPFGFEPVK